MWNSQADYEAFAAGLLMPTIARVAAAHGMEPPTEGVAPTFTEVFEVVAGK